MFKRLKISDWRQFSNVDISFHPHLTVLTGANGAGKTTILNLLSQSTGWDPQFVSSYEKDKAGISKYFNSLKNIGKRFFIKASNTPNAVENKLGELEFSDGTIADLILPQNVSSGTYSITTKGGKKEKGVYISSHRPSFPYRAVKTIPTSVATREQIFKKYDDFNRKFVFDTYRDSDKLSATALIKETIASLAIFGYGNQSVVANENAKKLFEGYADILKIVLPPKLGFEGISVIVPEVMLCTKTGNFPIDAVSGGISSIIDITWQLYMFADTSESFVAIIDEPENHLHPELQRNCLPFEGRSGLGVWGVYNDDVEATLQVIEKQFAPAVNQVLTEQGGIPVKGIIARSLQMNDDIHTRQTAAGLILLSEIAPKLMHSDLDREAITMCIEMFSSSERWFHPLGMASAMSTIRGLKGTEYSTVVTAICNGGVNTGLKVAALGEQWFTAPAPMLTGSYLSPQWSEKDASPYCGDSTITEVVGMGAFAGAAAPSVLRLRGGTYQDGINQSMDMRTLTVGLNSNYPIPLLDFTGPGLAIDIRKVINTGTPVVCHGGIISKDGGQIGAGIATFPMEVYVDAMYAFLKKYGIE